MKDVTAGSNPENYNSEKFVNEVILPMAKDLATICAESGIPAVICFQYSMEIDEDGDCAAGLATLLVPVAVSDDGEVRAISSPLMAAMRVLAPDFDSEASGIKRHGSSFSPFPICLN